MRQIRPNLFSPGSLSLGVRIKKGLKEILDFGTRRLSDNHGMARMASVSGLFS